MDKSPDCDGLVGRAVGRRSAHAGETGRIAARLYQLSIVLPAQLSRLRSLTPGPLPFSAMNSMPADSSAERIAASVRGCGDRFPISKSESVTLETPAAAATAAAVIPKAGARHSALLCGYGHFTQG